MEGLVTDDLPFSVGARERKVEGKPPLIVYYLFAFLQCFGLK